MDHPASSISYGLSMNNIDAIALTHDKKLTSNFRSQSHSYNMLKQNIILAFIIKQFQWKIQDNK